MSKPKTIINACECGHAAQFLDGDTPDALWLGCRRCDVGIEMKPTVPGKAVDPHELARVWNQLHPAPENN